MKRRPILELNSLAATALVFPHGKLFSKYRTQKCERPLTLSLGVVLSGKKTYLKHNVLLLLVPIPGGKPGNYQAVLSLVTVSPGDKSSQIGA